jgi:hypothetical protein
VEQMYKIVMRNYMCIPGDITLFSTMQNRDDMHRFGDFDWANNVVYQSRMLLAQHGLGIELWMEPL